MEGILEGRYVHCDLAMFTLHQQAVHQHKKSLMKRQDYLSMKSRLEIMYPIPEGFAFPLLTRAELPQDLLRVMDEHMNWDIKIEWMHKGEYFVEMMGDYKKKTDYNRFRNTKVYNKVVDTIGLSRWDMGYKMWVESLYRPGQVIFYQGKAFDMMTKSLVNRVVRMTSRILHYDAMITLTFIKDE